MIGKPSQRPKNYHLRTEYSPEHEFQTTDEDSPRRFIGARNIGMNGNPWTGDYRGEAAPKDVPNRTLIGWANACLCQCDYNSRIIAWLLKDTSEWCSVRLKAMKKIDESKDKKHAVKLTDNPEDGTPFITCQMGHALGMRTDLRLCSRRGIPGCQREGS